MVNVEMTTALHWFVAGAFTLVALRRRTKWPELCAKDTSSCPAFWRFFASIFGGTIALFAGIWSVVLLLAR